MINKRFALNTILTGIALGTMVFACNAFAQETKGAVTLAWEAPTANTDGSPITDFGGYILHYGAESNTYTEKVDVGNVLTYTFSDLPAGKYYFNITAYDTSGNESAFNGEVFTEIILSIDDGKVIGEVAGLEGKCISYTIYNYIGTNNICKDN